MAIAFGAAGAVAPGTTSLSVAYPTGITAGQLLVLFIANKYPTNAPSLPNGWTAPSGNQYSRGGGTPGADTGDVYITVFVRIADGTETGNLAVTLTGANTSLGVIFRVTKAAGMDWGYACAGGSDNAAGTSWSVTAGANPGVTASDMVFVGSAICGNTDTATAEAISQTGVTFGTMVERVDTGTNNGDDISIWVTEHPVSSGTGSAAPVYTATVAGTGSATAAGASLFLRLREVAAAQSVTPNFITSTETVYNSQINLNLVPDFITSTEAVYNPTVSAGASSQNVTPDFISSTESVFNPQINLNLVPDFITSSESVYSPQVNLSINPAFIVSEEQIFNPLVANEQTITLDFIASAESVYNPQLNLNVSPNFIASVEQVFNPNVNLNVILGFITSTETVYNPTITLSGGPQSVTPDFIVTSETVYNPQLNLNVLPDFIGSVEQVYNPTITVSGGPQSVTPDFIISSESVYNPQINLNVVPGFIASTESVYAPSLVLNIIPDFIPTGEIVYAPTLLYNQSVTPNFISSAEVVYNPTVSGGQAPITPDERNLDMDMTNRGSDINMTLRHIQLKGD